MIRFLKIFLIILFFFNNLFALNNIADTSYINTQNISYDDDNQIVELGENSLVNLNGTNILTDKAIIDYPNDKILIYGKFYLYQDINILTGYGLNSSLNLKNFETNKVSLLYNENLKIDSNKATREDGVIYFYDNFLTPCDIKGFFNCPTWSLKIHKTKYIIEKDKFIHYDSFLQVADNKIFYLPYFSHYGAKAPRQKGFLTPTLEFNLLGAGTSVNIPYYLPFNQSSDLTITPKLTFLPSSLEFSKNFELNSKLRSKVTGGQIFIDMNTNLYENDSNIYNTIKLDTKQTINKKNNFEISTLLTNSVSSSRLGNEEEIPFENSYVRINSFGILNNSDILVSEINTVTAFDNSNNALVPYQIPNLKYSNTIDYSNSYLNNNFELSYLKRNQSNIVNPSENFGLYLENIFNKNYLFNNSYLYNKLLIKNDYKNLRFSHNSDLDTEYIQSSINLSSDINNYTNNSNFRIKLLYNEDFNTFKNYNEDSHTISFNYNNLFQESRFFGKDTSDRSIRIAYGLELKKNNISNQFKLNIGQSYDLDENNNYLKKINQHGNFSDLALQSQLKFDNFRLLFDSRIDQQKLSKKEMNYSFYYENNLKFLVSYNETSKESYELNSDDSKSLYLFASKELTNNTRVALDMNLDLKNEYKPYESGLQLSFFDECSQLDLHYKNSKFSDNFNTTPRETISITFKMDYLGFFGYEQDTNIFFSEPGNINYGL